MSIFTCIKTEETHLETVAVLGGGGGGGGGPGGHGPPDFFASAIFVCTELYCRQLYILFIHTQNIEYLTIFFK